MNFNLFPLSIPNKYECFLCHGIENRIPGSNRQRIFGRTPVAAVYEVLFFPAGNIDILSGPKLWDF